MPPEDIGRFDGRLKTGVSDRQDLKITVFGQFRHFLDQILHSGQFPMKNGYVPLQKIDVFGPELTPKNVTLVNYWPDSDGVFTCVNATSLVTRLYPSGN